tara:strand:- start:644 stop:904 length:261 start_codon:yes stop_codon:yes gene_type:complete
MNNNMIKVLKCRKRKDINGQARPIILSGHYLVELRCKVNYEHIETIRIPVTSWHLQQKSRDVFWMRFDEVSTHCMKCGAIEYEKGF